MQIKTTMRYHCIPIKTAKIKGYDTTKCWCRFRKTGFLIHCFENVKWYSHSGKYLEFSLKLNIYLSYDQAISLLCIYPREKKIYVHIKICTWMCFVYYRWESDTSFANTFSQGGACDPMYMPFMNVYSSFICNDPKLEATKKSLNWWIVRQTMVHPYHALLCSAMKRNKLLIHRITWRGLKGIMVSKKCQPQMVIYCMIPFV